MRLGHQVDLLCQDRHADEFDFVGAVADWDSGELSVREVRPAGATVYRPDIGGLLPVYVADTYEDIEARPFQELSDEQVDAYVDANVAAVSDVAARSKPDVALANHLIMGPVVLARALSTAAPLRREGPRLSARVHGQAVPAVPALRTRGDRLGPRRARGLAAHGGEPVGGARGRRTARKDEAGPTGRGHRHLHAAGPRPRDRPPKGARDQPRRSARSARKRRLGVQSRPAGDRTGRRRPRARRRRRPARDIRRQADRLQGHRPAAPGMAAGARRDPRCPARRGRLRRIPRGLRAHRRRAGTRRPDGAAGARRPGARGGRRTASAAAPIHRVPGLARRGGRR